MILSLLPIDVRQYGTRAAISTWHSWSTYRNRAIFRSYLPSGARFITAFICSASSPCNAGGKTMRAAATGSTEPERLRQLSRVAHHSGDRVVVCMLTNHLTGELAVCSACHDILLNSCSNQCFRFPHELQAREDMRPSQLFALSANPKSKSA